MVNITETTTLADALKEEFVQHDTEQQCSGHVETKGLNPSATVLVPEASHNEHASMLCEDLVGRLDHYAAPAHRQAACVLVRLRIGAGRHASLR